MTYPKSKANIKMWYFAYPLQLLAYPQFSKLRSAVLKDCFFEYCELMEDTLTNVFLKIFWSYLLIELKIEFPDDNLVKFYFLLVFYVLMLIKIIRSNYVSFSFQACGNMFKLMQGFSAETSGGLLICLPREQAAAYCKVIFFFFCNILKLDTFYVSK